MSFERWHVALIGILMASTIAHGERRDPPSSFRPASEQKQLKDLSLEQLGNVQVTSYSKTPRGLWDTPAALYIITSDDILRSGATSIADALRLAPGVEVARFSSDSWAVGIRGLQNNFSKSVLVLIDGRNVYTPLFAGVYWDVQDLPLDNIDHIEVIRGPGGTIWGPNAANGVINIITKNAADTQGVTANGLGGTQAHTIDDLQYGAKAKGFSYRIFGRGFERAHEFHSDGQNEDAWHQERVGARMDFASGRDTYFAEGSAYRGNSPRIVGTTPQYDETSGGDVNLRWDHAVNKDNGFYVQAYFDRTLRTDPNPTAFGESRNTIDVDFIHHFEMGARQKFSYGGGLRWSPYRIITSNPYVTILPSTALDHVYTAFVQDEIPLGSKVSVTAGAKLQENNYSGFDIQPSARLLWTMGEHESLWMGITRAVTTPSDLEEGFLEKVPLGTTEFLQVVGDRKFKSEDVLGYELGYRILRGDRFYIDLSTFWSQYSNLQSFSALTPSVSGGDTYLTIQYQNQIEGHTSGFEFAPQLSITPWWRVNTSYSFVSSNFGASGATSNISSSGSVPTYEGSSPRHKVFLQSKVDLPWHFQFDQMYRYVSALPAQKVKAYQTMDLVIHRPLGRNLALEVVGQNLFQEHHYEWGTGDPTQPLVGIYRAAYAQITFRSNGTH